MILPGQMIRERSDVITPFHERTILRGRSFGLSMAGYDVRIAQNLDVSPGGFVLGSTVERFDMPADLLGLVKDKSSWARAGIAVQNTVIEPGWKGHLTVEITNHGPDEIRIEAGDPIAQILFMLLAAPAVETYQGKYQNQGPAPQEAILE